MSPSAVGDTPHPFPLAGWLQVIPCTRAMLDGTLLQAFETEVPRYEKVRALCQLGQDSHPAADSHSEWAIKTLVRGRKRPSS